MSEKTEVKFGDLVLKVGDRVRMRENASDYDPAQTPSGPTKNMLGTVRAIHPAFPLIPDIAVDFDDPIGHDGFGVLPVRPGHGWIVDIADIEPAQETPAAA